MSAVCSIFQRLVGIHPREGGRRPGEGVLRLHVEALPILLLLIA